MSRPPADAPAEGASMVHKVPTKGASVVHIHVHVHVQSDPALLVLLQDVKVSIAHASTKLERHMSKLDDKITELQAQVSKVSGVVDSAVALIGGIADQVKAAVEAALAEGATPEELQAMTDLGTSLESQSKALADAVAANTPAA